SVTRRPPERVVFFVLFPKKKTSATIFPLRLEGSHSGLVRTLGKRVTGKLVRGFESLSLRHSSRSQRIRNRSLKSVGWPSHMLVLSASNRPAIIFMHGLSILFRS